MHSLWYNYQGGDQILSVVWRNIFQRAGRAELFMGYDAIVEFTVKFTVCYHLQDMYPSLCF